MATSAMSWKLLTNINELIASDFTESDLTPSDVIQALRILDDLYHNGEQSPLSDAEYDALLVYAKSIIPNHKYFIGVGSDVRGGKVNLPFKMGSLNQVHIGEIGDWVNTHNLQNETLIITDKMDGTSALIIYDENGEPQIAYSRGNGTEGADISRHIFKISNVPNKVSGPLVVRVEVEMTDSNFLKFQKKYTRSGGSPYKNSRNATSGLMNSKHTHSDEVYKWLSVIAYEVVS